VRHYTNLKHMHAKLNTVLSRHKFQPFKDVMAAEAIGTIAELNSRCCSSIDGHLNEPVHTTARGAEGGR
jgi:hypothetical protein